MKTELAGHTKKLLAENRGKLQNCHGRKKKHLFRHNLFEVGNGSTCIYVLQRLTKLKPNLTQNRMLNKHKIVSVSHSRYSNIARQLHVFTLRQNTFVAVNFPAVCSIWSILPYNYDIPIAHVARQPLCMWAFAWSDPALHWSVHKATEGSLSQRYKGLAMHFMQLNYGNHVCACSFNTLKPEMPMRR